MDDIPPLSDWIYAVIFAGLVASFFFLSYGSMLFVDDPNRFIWTVFGLNFLIFISAQYTAGILNVFCGLKTSYSRKIGHLTMFSLPFIIDALSGSLDDDGLSTFLSLSWNLWQFQCW